MTIGAKAKKSKKPFTKTNDYKPVCKTNRWTIVSGNLVRKQGRPDAVRSLFKAVAEKIPYQFIDAVAEKLKEKNISAAGVYMAHDSMGCPRYIGRGTNVFARLRERHEAQVLELAYFSFYIVDQPKHIREIETIMIRAAGPLLHFNERKKRIDIQAGDVKDFEGGTAFFQRQYTRGPRAKAAG